MSVPFASVRIEENLCANSGGRTLSASCIPCIDGVTIRNRSKEGF